MNWTFQNGQWFLNGQPSATPPAVGVPFTSVDVNGHQDFRTYGGPESMEGVGAPINPTLPRNNTTVPAPTPRRPYQVRAPGAGGGTNGPATGPTPTGPGWQQKGGVWYQDGQPSQTPPPANTPYWSIGPDGQQEFLTYPGSTTTPPAGTPPAAPPTTPRTPPLRQPTVAGATRPGNIPNNIFMDPEAVAPPGYAEDKWANRFVLNSAQNAKANGPLATVPGPRVVENRFAVELDPRLQMPNKGTSINTAEFDPRLIGSIQDAAKYGIAGSGVGNERAQYILDGISNPAIVANALRSIRQGGGGRRDSGSPSNPIDILGAAYDRGQQMAAEEIARDERQAALLADPNSHINRMARRKQTRMEENGFLPRPPAPPPPYAGDDQAEGEVFTNPDGSLGVSLSADDSLLGGSPVAPSRRSTDPRADRNNRNRGSVSRYAGGTVNPFMAQRQAMTPVNNGFVNAFMAPPRPMPLPQMPIGMPAPIMTTPAPIPGRALAPPMPMPWVDPRRSGRALAPRIPAPATNQRGVVNAFMRGGVGANNAPFR